MDKLDILFVELLKRWTGALPIIACLYTGSTTPSPCVPMLRSPEPQTGQPLDELFADHLASALVLNPAVHDGAIMLGRENKSSPYRIAGWSYRLFPPSLVRGTVPNRGSAFNSCLDMSSVSGVDRLYLIGPQGSYRFDESSAIEIATIVGSSMKKICPTESLKS
jgi:hypothetical protein